jgi:hypothetical protein
VGITNSIPGGQEEIFLQIAGEHGRVAMDFFFLLEAGKADDHVVGWKGKTRATQEEQNGFVQVLYFGSRPCPRLAGYIVSDCEIYPFMTTLTMFVKME